MINRYTYAPIGRTPHMEPMGAGEWVKWDDHASHIAAANQRHTAAIEAVATARADGYAEGLKAARDACVGYRHDPETSEHEAIGALECALLIGNLIPASPAEPAPAMKNRRAYQIGLIVGKAARQAEIDQASTSEPAQVTVDGTITTWGNLSIAIYDAMQANLKVTPEGDIEGVATARDAALHAIAGGKP